MQFDTDFEYDEWFEKKQEDKLLDQYFGIEIKEGENGDRI